MFVQSLCICLSFNAGVNNSLLAQGNPRGFWYLHTVQSMHMRHSDNPLRKLLRKTAASSRNWTLSTAMRVSNLNHCTNLTHFYFLSCTSTYPVLNLYLRQHLSEWAILFYFIISTLMWPQFDKLLWDSFSKISWHPWPIILCLIFSENLVC